MKRRLSISIAGILALNLVNLANAQNLFVPDYSGNIIGEISPGGVQSTFDSGLNGPFGVAFNSAGSLFVSDSISGNIYEYTPGEARSTFASGLYYPAGIAFDSAGNLFVASVLGGSITEITPGGVKSTFASGLAGPVRMAFDSAGNLFVAESSRGSIIEITPGGVQSTFASGLPGANGVAFNSAGNLFVSLGSGDIFEYTPSGVQSTFATGLNNPGGMEFDSAGNLFVADSSGNIYEFSPGGVRSTVGTGFQQPQDVAIQPVPEPSALNFEAVVHAVSISTNSAGDLVYRHFGNRDLIRECANQMDVTNQIGLYLVYDLGNDALEVVRGCGTNQTLVCTPLTFSGGVFLGNAKATKSERQAWVYWHGQTTPSGTLTATERYGYGATNQLTRFTLSGELQFAVPGSGTNKPTIYQGRVEAGSRASLHRD